MGRDRQRQVENLLNRMPADRFNKLVNMGKMINDFSATGDEGAAGGAEEGQMDEVRKVLLVVVLVVVMIGVSVRIVCAS